MVSAVFHHSRLTPACFTFYSTERSFDETRTEQKVHKGKRKKKRFSQASVLDWWDCQRTAVWASPPGIVNVHLIDQLKAKPISPFALCSRVPSCEN